ncbi:HAD-IA family hydrolase [Streptomyces sp. NPDC048301]|uniref:HAD family hydrolase n=1 Tax=unclassified Streptomyces TaxID=2593676 RepID=UPI003420CBD2
MSARRVASFPAVSEPEATWDEAESIRLLENADCVLFDFDGPLCDLFAERPATGIAASLVRQLPSFGCDPRMVISSEGDPLALLRDVFKHHGAGRTTSRTEDFLAREEIEAAASARPTEYALELLEALDAGGWKQAITTNNSPAAVRRFLAVRQGSFSVAEHVHGRGPDPALLKPDPHCLERALESTGSDAASAVMIGDSYADLRAAEAIGVPFIGYAVDERRRGALREWGARCVVLSLRCLVRVAEVSGRSRESGAGQLPAGVHG